MPGLVPGIHVFTRSAIKDVDGRDKPGHDDDHVHSNQIRNQTRPRGMSTPSSQVGNTSGERSTAVDMPKQFSSNFKFLTTDS